MASSVASCSCRLFTSARTTTHSFRRQTLCKTFPSFKRHSHVGAQVIEIPDGVSCTLASLPGQRDFSLRIQGAQGTRTVSIPAGIQPIITQIQPSTLAAEQSTTSASSSTASPKSSSTLNLACSDPDAPGLRAKWGLTAALVGNAMRGVHEGYTVKLRLVGVGYRAALESPAVEAPMSTSPASSSLESRQILVMRLGYSRPIRVAVPTQISCAVLSPTDIELRGMDKQELGQFAATIRGWRPPEPYNGKGIFVGGESIRRKELKKK